MPNNIERVLVIDLEATCWENKTPPLGESSEIIEIGICVLDIRTKTVEKPVSIYISPVASTLSEYCKNLTGITPKMVYKSGVTFTKATDRLVNKYGSKNKAWASFGDGDMEMFETQCLVNDIEYPFGKTYFNVQTLFSMKNQITKMDTGLTSAMSISGLEFEGRAHSGAVDAYNTAILLGKLLWNETPSKSWKF